MKPFARVSIVIMYIIEVLCAITAAAGFLFKSLHLEGAGSGVLEGAKGLRNGSFAELIGHIMLMPERERGRYYIEKHGDREFHFPEIAALASRDDFPAL